MVGGEGDDQLWGSGRGAVAGCHCRVPERRVTTNFGGVDVVPLLGAGCHCWVPGCHCWVPLQGARGEGDDQLWGSGRWVPY